MRVIKCKVTSIEDQEYQKLFNAIGRPNEEIVNRSYFQHVGFTSIPPAGSVGILIIDGDNISMIASADQFPTESEKGRPQLSNERDVAIYADQDKFIKISANGDIDIRNNGNRIMLKANGDIELGLTNLKKLLNEAAKDLYNNHGHDYVVSGSPFITSKPTTAAIAAAVPAPMGTSHMTDKTEAQ